MPAGEVCAICGRPIVRHTHWSLIRDLGPAHTRCGFVQGEFGKTTSRDWQQGVRGSGWSPLPSLQKPGTRPDPGDRHGLSPA
jgi:hypothetical protein